MFSDVKPANFMLKFKLDEETNAEDSSHPLVVKGIDFGCSQRLGDPEEHNMLTKRTGTPAYWAPEVFMRYYNHQADVWSCGMMLYEMLVGKLPFWDDIESCTPKQVHKGVMRGKVSFAGKARQYDVYDSLDGSQSLDSWDAEECDAEGNCGISPEAQDLILRMLDKNPASRITAEQALEHPVGEEVEALGRDCNCTNSGEGVAVRPDSIPTFFSICQDVENDVNWLVFQLRKEHYIRFFSPSFFLCQSLLRVLTAWPWPWPPAPRGTSPAEPSS